MVVKRGKSTVSAVVGGVCVGALIGVLVAWGLLHWGAARTPYSITTPAGAELLGAFVFGVPLGGALGAVLGVVWARRDKGEQ